MREEGAHAAATGRFLRLILRETTWASRRLGRTPGFVAVAVLTLAVAISPSLIFRLVDKAVLPPLPYPRSQDLVAIWQRFGFGRMATSYPKIQFLSEGSRTTDYAAYTGGMFFLERGGDSIRLSAEAVTPGFFSVLGARPFLGRVFREDENLAVLGHPVVVLSHAFWQSHLGGRPEVVGEEVRLNGRAFRVVGVMPEDFREYWWQWRGLAGSDAWIPAMMAPAGMHPSAKAWRDTPLAIEAPGASVWLAIGRLRPGHSLAEARAEADLLGREVAARWPDSNEGVRQPFELIPLSEEAVDPRILHAVSLLEVAGALILLLGALNLGHLFLARALARAQALGLHNVLGAPRAALVWGAGCEALIIGVAGAFVAVLLTRGALAALAIAEPTILTAPFGVTFDPSAWRVDWGLAATALALAALAAFVFGLAPAWRTATLDTSSFLRVGSGVKAGGLRQLRLTRPRGLLVAAEAALALALAFPALLLVQTMGHLVQADLGFQPQGVATAELRLPAEPASVPAALGFISEGTRQLAQSPGIASASWVSCLPIECGFYTSAVKVAGEREATMVASVHVVAPDAFRTLGIPLRSGRDFGPDDRSGTTPMVILSEQAARRLGNVGPGSRIEVPVIGREALEVAGIVGDVPYRDLAAEPMPAVYLPLAQRPQTEGVLVARGVAGDATAIVDPFRQAVASMGLRLEPLVVSALSARVEQTVARFRGAAWLLGVAAALGLFLSGVGVYGLLSSLVAQSRPEMAIRLALGAAPAVLARSLATATLRLALAGLVVGASLGSWGATYLRSYLYGVSPWDVKALAASVVAAIGLAALAALRPSYQASQADPMTSLRCE
jgi:predicted permease